MEVHDSIQTICNPGRRISLDNLTYYVALEKSKYKSSRDAFRHWFSVAEKIDEFTVNGNRSTAENFCSASVDQTAGWIALMD